MASMFGHYIKTLRIESHKTQTDIANALNCDRVAVHNWEKGKNLPDWKKLQPLANVLGVSFNEFISELGAEIDLVRPRNDNPSEPLTSESLGDKRQTGISQYKFVRDPVLDDLDALLPEDADVWRAQIKAAATKARREAALLQQISPPTSQQEHVETSVEETTNSRVA